MATQTVRVIHCANCGAPAIPLTAAGAAFCTYCGAYHVPTFAPPTPAGVHLRGSASSNACPVCARAMHEAVVADFPVQHCAGCGGLLCAMEHFAALVKTRRAEYDGAERPPQAINRAELERRMRCPGCGAAMETHPYAGAGNVVIDTCVPCGHVWLDGGELSALERAPGRR